MARSGAYEFKLAVAAKDALIEDEARILPGEWAWVEMETTASGGHYRAIYARCPDCLELMTLWRSFGNDQKGHTIDGAGNVHPSVLHSWPVNGVEQCGFHTMPTRLLGFIDRRQ